MKKYFLSLGACLCILSCTYKDVIRPEQGAVAIRIQNTSPYNLDNIYVSTSGGSNLYTSISPGSISKYEYFQLTFRYAYIKFYIGSKEFIFQPIDYVGETPFQSGKFTLILRDIDLSTRQFSFELLAD